MGYVRCMACRMSRYIMQGLLHAKYAEQVGIGLLERDGRYPLAGRVRLRGRPPRERSAPPQLIDPGPDDGQHDAPGRPTHTALVVQQAGSGQLADQTLCQPGIGFEYMFLVRHAAAHYHSAALQKNSGHLAKPEPAVPESMEM